MENSPSNAAAPSLLDRLDRTPPFAVYYLARLSKCKRSHPGIKGVSKRSGLSRSTIERLSRRMTWAGVTLDTMDRFCAACGVNFLKVSRNCTFMVQPHRRYLSCVAEGKFKNPLQHLGVRQKSNFNKRCQQWSAQRKS